jgi:hypothetical protein
MKQWVLILICCLAMGVSNSARCEDWKEIYTMAIQTTYEGQVIKVYSEVFYDKDNIKVTVGSPIYRVWTKTVKYINQKEETVKELYLIDCTARKYKVLVGGITDKALLELMGDNIVPNSVPGNLAEVLCAK